MSVDYLVCNHCGRTFCDCGSFIRCESCGNSWCDDECAEDDGYIQEHCTKYDIYGCDDMNDAKEDNECEHKWCCDCEHYEGDSCKYCRKEDYDDSPLLIYALSLLKQTREELIQSYKQSL